MVEYAVLDITDYQEICVLWSSIEALHLTAADGEASIRSYLERNYKQSFVCKADNRIVGAVLCGNDGRRAFIYHLAVDNDYRRQGIGKRLVELAIAAQKSLGIGRAAIFVMKSNENGLVFWKHIGFEVQNVIKIMSIDI